ncbi:MAG: DUF502 domain-containing protein [Dehalococcoidia bacterium]|nr:MAG: DUF502 domain-containing protein [Dehalococcoidia bacterium]
MTDREEQFSYRFLKLFRRNFVAGMLVVVPLIIASWILWWVFSSVDSILQPLIEAAFGREIQGLGFAIFLVIIYITGVVASNYLGKRAINFADTLARRVPIFRQLYIGAKQVVEGLSGKGMNQAAFREVVFVEFPRPGMTTIAFVTNIIKDKDGKKYYGLYVPTAPVPTSGYFEVATEEQIIHTSISIDEGIKIVVSSGMILPDKVATGKLEVTGGPESLADAFTSLGKPEGNTQDECE